LVWRELLVRIVHSSVALFTRDHCAQSITQLRR
jgi:hypothetical protein